MRKLLVLGIVMLSFALIGCGPSEPSTCEECLAQQGAAMTEDGCWPYCEPIDQDGDGIFDDADACPTERETVNWYQDGDGCPDVEPQVEPQGTYDGYITLTGWEGPDTSRCGLIPVGSRLPLYIVIQGQDVRERIYPCEAPVGSPEAYSVLCINHAIDQVCDPATDPRCSPSHPDYYYERRDFRLSFTRDARRVTGTLTDTRNWGGCSVRRWTVDFAQRP